MRLLKSAIPLSRCNPFLIGLIGAVVAGVMLITPSQADPSSSPSISVNGNDTVDGYQGSGGLLLPTSFTGTATHRKRVAGCLGCRWRYTPYCEQDSDALCAHAVVTCSTGKIRYRVWFGRSETELKVIGSVCWGSGKPATRVDLNRTVTQNALRLVPSLAPGVNPVRSTLVSVPIIVWSGQPKSFKPRAMTLVGHRVTIEANALWLWEWGDGARQWVSHSGAAYPRRDITHHYRRPGSYQVTVTTVWRADYSVTGLGRFPVEGEVIRQRKTLKIVVKPSRAVLVTAAKSLR